MVNDINRLGGVDIEVSAGSHMDRTAFRHVTLLSPRISLVTPTFSWMGGITYNGREIGDKVLRINGNIRGTDEQLNALAGVVSRLPNIDLSEATYRFSRDPKSRQWNLVITSPQLPYECRDPFTLTLEGEITLNGKPVNGTVVAYGVPTVNAIQEILVGQFLMEAFMGIADKLPK